MNNINTIDNSEKENEYDIIVHTDGGCRIHGNKKGQHVKKDDVAAWAYLIEYLKIDNRDIDYFSGVMVGVTNNKMEIMALVKSLIKLYKLDLFDKNILIVSDSKYVLDTITFKRLNKWRNANWTKNGGPIKNLELWKKIELLLSQFTNIHFKWVRGHSKNDGNIFVDKLLNKAMDNYEKKYH